MADYGSPPYQESGFKAVLRRLASGAGPILMGLGTPVRPGAGFLETLGASGATSYRAASAAQQAAQEYAMKQQQMEEDRQNREITQAYTKALTENLGKEKTPGKQQDYEQLIKLGRTPDEARQIVYGLTLEEQQKQKADQAATSAGPGLDDRTLNGLAKAIHEQGLDALSKLGFGNKSAGMRQAALQRWAALYPDDDLATIGAGFKADQASATKLQTQSDAVSAFKNTVSANRKILDEVKGKIPEIGVRFLNRPWRAAASQLGSTSMAKYEAALRSIQTEYGRIIANPNLTGTLTDTARHEVEALAKGDLTWGQLMEALNTLERESDNRKFYFQNQINTIKGRIGGKQETQGGATATQADKDYVKSLGIK